MIKKIDIMDIISECRAMRVDEYIKYYFSKFALMNRSDAVYFNLPQTPFYISIVKDSTNRILEQSKGKLMEKGWRICIFYFMNKSILEKYFGVNSKYYEMEIQNGFIEYSEKLITNYQGKFPNNLRMQEKDFYEIQNRVLTYFKEQHSSWFVRSYVYINMIICDETETISNQNYKINYWNTNYNFARPYEYNNLFFNSKYSYFESQIEVELENIEASNKEIIDCVKAYTGDLDFKLDTEENYYEIKNDIDNGIPYIVVEGSARTGKTIIAMRLLGNYPESKLLIMNYYFFQALKDGFGVLKTTFPEKRIYHHNLELNKRDKGGWISNVRTKQIVPSLSFLIVDEAQRLSYLPSKPEYGLSSLDEIDAIINCPDHKHTIFLGDNFQRLNPRYDEGFERILKMLSDKDFREYSFRDSIGVPPEILNNVKYLIDTNNDYIPQNPNNFQISVTNDIENFVSSFLEDKVKRKHYVYVGLMKANESPSISFEDSVISTLPVILRDKNFNFLFDNEISSKYMLSTYEVISREIESVYLFLPKIISFDSNSNKLLYNGYELEHLFMHLYVLMTRATLKLKIFCESEELFNYFNEKVNNILELKKTNDEVTKIVQENTTNPSNQKGNGAIVTGLKYDVFIAYHGTNDPNGSYIVAKAIADELKKSGFSVFLNDYLCFPDDEDLGFNETCYILQKADVFLLVFNDFVSRDELGMIMRKYDDGTPNQLYHELRTFTDMVNTGERTNRKNLRFFYSGNRISKDSIYRFLNSFYREGTYGNSNCCFYNINEILSWLKNRKK